MEHFWKNSPKAIEAKEATRRYRKSILGRTVLDAVVWNRPSSTRLGVLYVFGWLGREQLSASADWTPCIFVAALCVKSVLNMC